MIAVKDGVALYEGDLVLTDHALKGKDFVDHRLNTSNAELIDIPTPRDFKGGKYTWDGSTLSMAEAYKSGLIEEKKADLKINVNQFRKNKVKGGIILSGVEIDTDSESQSMMTSALVVLEKGSKGNAKYPDNVKWRTKSGQFIPVDYTSMEDIVTAVTAFVEGCFSAEASHVAAIESITTLDEASNYDYTAGWPSEVIS